MLIDTNRVSAYFIPFLFIFILYNVQGILISATLLELIMLPKGKRLIMRTCDNLEQRASSAALTGTEEPWLLPLSPLLV